MSRTSARRAGVRRAGVGRLAAVTIPVAAVVTLLTMVSVAAAPNTINGSASAGAVAKRLDPLATQPPSPGGSPTFGGCPVLPADNPFNTQATGYAVRPESAATINATNAAGGGSTMLFQFWSKPTSGFQPIVVPANQPNVPIVYDQYPESSDPGPFPIPLDAPTEDNGDNHVVVVQQGTCQLYELWAAHRLGAGWAAGTGAQWNLLANETSPLGWVSADAAGLPILPGLLRYDDVASGSINHVLRMTVGTTRRAYILPATSIAAGSSSTAYFPNGARLRLKASYDIGGFTGQAKVIAQAMKSYGLIVADQGPNWMISGVGDARWDDNNMNQVRNIPASALEYLDSGPIHT